MELLAGLDVLVTGGAGFIGSHLTRRLVAGGAAVRVLEHPSADVSRISAFEDRLTIARADLTDVASIEQAIDAAPPVVVWHLAGWTGGRGMAADLKAWRRSFQVNLDGTLNLIAALAPHAKRVGRVVRTGSMEEYGNGPVPFRENQREQAVSPYSASVVAATQAAHLLAGRLGLPLVTVRPAIVYGPGQDADFFIPGLIRACLAGQPFPMTAGEQSADFIYVEDVVDAMITAATVESAPGSIFNAGTGRAVRVRDLAERIAGRTGATDTLRIGAVAGREGEASRRFVDPARAAEVLGWQATTDLEAGLDRTIAWFRAGEPALTLQD